MASQSLKTSKSLGSSNAQNPKTAEPTIRLETRAFDLCQERYANLIELANAMGISVSQVYRVRQGKRPIGEKFIIGAMRAFPQYRLDDLFYVVPARKQHGKK